MTKSILLRGICKVYRNEESGQATCNLQVAKIIGKSSKGKKIIGPLKAKIIGKNMSCQKISMLCIYIFRYAVRPQSSTACAIDFSGTIVHGIRLGVGNLFILKCHILLIYLFLYSNIEFIIIFHNEKKHMLFHLILYTFFPMKQATGWLSVYAIRIKVTKKN